MSGIVKRLSFLFNTTQGLILLAVTLVMLLLAIVGPLSAGPIAELGIKQSIADFWGMQIKPPETTARIIMLYHAIAIAVVAIEVYIINDLLHVEKNQRKLINGIITAGYIITLIFGIAFAYYGQNAIFHGLFLFGLSLVFLAGVLLAKAIWPWRSEFRVKDYDYSHTKGGLSVERLAFFTMVIASLGSAIFGAIPGSFFGFRFVAFLAENIVRMTEKTTLQLSVIGHLHIMVTLVAIALALIVGRWLDFKGRLHKISMPLMIAGTIVLTLGVWLVVPFESIAHTIIYVGSFMVLLGALFLVIFGLRKLFKGIGENSKPGIRTMLSNPLKFGALWQMIYMNFVVTFVGIFMAIRLDEIRSWLPEEERVITTGHWHILAAIIGTIIILYFADRSGLTGRFRHLFAWLLIIGSDLAFGAMTMYELENFFAADTERICFLIYSIGMIMSMIAIAGLLVWLLLDLLRKNGNWSRELSENNGS